MALAFCATSHALTLCRATLPPAVLCATFACTTPAAVAAELAHLPAGAIVLLERGAADTTSYQAAAALAVSMLSKQTEFVILGPSLLADAPIAVENLGSGDLQPGPAGALPAQAEVGPRHVGCLAAAVDLAPLLSHPGVRVLLLDGDVFAWYDAAKGALHIGGKGCAVLLTRKAHLAAAAGSADSQLRLDSLVAAVTLDVLAPGATTSW